MPATTDVTRLTEAFGARILKTVEFRGEQTLHVEPAVLHEVLAKCRNELGYEMVLDISSVDHFGDDPRFEMVYEIAAVNDSSRLRVKAAFAEDEKVPSVTDLWAGADWHEREVWDMMGIPFSGHPNLKRILMWEGYPFFPLRKDFPLAGRPSDMPDVAFSGVAPLEGGPFVTCAGGEDTVRREPRARVVGRARKIRRNSTVMQFSGGSFSGVGKNLKQLLHSPASWAWVGMILAIQMMVAIGGGPDRLGWVFENFGLSREGFLSGRIWQIFSYGFLHGGWWHATLNALFILLIGSRIEHVAGSLAMSLATLAGVLGGGLIHLLIGSGLLVGLSGGCLALLLMLTTLSPESRMFPLLVSGRSLGLGILLAELILALINPDLRLPGFSPVGRMLVDEGLGSWFQMGHACHLGGGLAGWMCGRWMLRPRVTRDRLRRERARREAG